MLEGGGVETLFGGFPFEQHFSYKGASLTRALLKYCKLGLGFPFPVPEFAHIYGVLVAAQGFSYPAGRSEHIKVFNGSPAMAQHAGSSGVCGIKLSSIAR